jgi:hypothetical protein
MQSKNLTPSDFIWAKARYKKASRSFVFGDRSHTVERQKRFCEAYTFRQQMNEIIPKICKTMPQVGASEDACTNFCDFAKLRKSVLGKFHLKRFVTSLTYRAIKR